MGILHRDRDLVAEPDLEPVGQPTPDDHAQPRVAEPLPFDERCPLTVREVCSFDGEQGDSIVSQWSLVCTQ